MDSRTVERINVSSEPGVPVGCDYTDEEREWLCAVERYRSSKGRRFPTLREVLAIAKSLGYRKVAKASPLPVPVVRTETTYEIVSPVGDRYLVSGIDLTEFCKKYGLQRCSLLATVNGSRRTTKGWSCTKSTREQP